MTVWSVFTKPWSPLAAPELGDLVSGLGFAGAEVPVRDNAFVTPERARDLLPGFVAELAARGVRVVSVAGDPTEPLFVACAAAGVPLVRVMAPVGDDGYRASVARTRALLEECLPWTERYGVHVGVQPHHGAFVSTVLGVLDLLDGLPVASYRLVWDAAHDALAGDDPAVTLPLAAERLAIVNLKNAVYRRDGTGWRSWFVPGPAGMSDWSAVLAQVRALGFTGPVCLSGQYSEPGHDVAALLRDDLTYARALQS
jgi:sugar phosphate isomerase/epimerase